VATAIAASSHSARGVSAGSAQASAMTLPAILRTGLGVRPTHSLIRLASERADRACRSASGSRRTELIRGWMKGFSLGGSAPNATAAPAAAASAEP
jgi:hypothetical protein